MESIVLFNATGAQGGTIARALKKKGKNVIAPVRSKEKIQILEQQDVTGHHSDFSTASLIPIIKKADKVVLQIPAIIAPEQMVALCSNAVEAIMKAGYPKTVFVISSTIPMGVTGKSSVDARLKMKQIAEVKLPETPILSATEYLENFSTAYRVPILNDGVIPQTIPADRPVNYLSWQDLADYVTAALESDKLEGKVYPIGGIAGLTGIDLANRLGKVLSKDLQYVPITHEQLSQALTPILGEAIARDYAEFYEWQDSDGAELLNPDTNEIRTLLNLKLPSFESWAETAFK